MASDDDGKFSMFGSNFMPKGLAKRHMSVNPAIKNRNAYKAQDIEVPDVELVSVQNADIKSLAAFELQVNR